ncbi:calcium-binding protein [Rhizorhabdus sp.]|uniref:calcium-binding protein n=1 Tax=Rhizorhabdus sp. TaxID=1968843 RepID=UPI0019C8FD86|nr:calcium-binding protein [Rhizorhabdus sp.]MBD3759413.1 hypothetical protein [Rhizorhabdus sp.]
MAILDGTAGNDILTGDDADSSGAGGNDTIHGGAGNDIIDGRGGINQIFGDEGDDRIRITIATLPASDVNSTVDGGGGTDTLDLSGSPLVTDIAQSSTGADIFTVRVGSPNGVLFSEILVREGSGIEHFVLGPIYASLLLPNWTTPLVVESPTGGSRISTGIGDDSITGGANGDVITLNGGNDVVVGGNGPNAFNIARISGHADQIRITGGTGREDYLIFEDAALAGNRLSVDLASGVATLGSTSIGFSGIENVRFGGVPMAVIVYGDDGQNLIGAENSSTGIEAHGRGGVDVLAGSSGGDTLSGDDGDDYLYGYAGDDQLRGGAGDDRIFGGGGNNRIDGGDGHDWLQGNAERSGEPGVDTISGGAGNDHIWGNAQGAGQFDSADGGDSIDGGDGADYVNGNAGADTILGGAGADRLLGGAGHDSISGGADPDQINGNKGNDVINGGDGNDVLRGGQDDDNLTGGNGNDILFGDLGNDTLHAGAGVDILTGGDGGDLFDLSAAGAASIDPSGYFTAILDYARGTDHLKLGFTPTASDVLRGSVGFANEADAFAAAQDILSAHAGTVDVAVLQVGADAFLFYNAAGTGGTVTAAVALSNVGAASIDASDFI